MKLKVVPPRNVAVLQLTLPKHGRVKVFVVLRMRMLADESTYVNVLASSVIEHHIDRDIVVAYKAYYLQDVLVHSSSYGEFLLVVCDSCFIGLVFDCLFKI